MANKKQQRIIEACVDCSDCKKVTAKGVTKWRCAEKRKFLSGEVNFMIGFPDWCTLKKVEFLDFNVVSIMEKIEHVEDTGGRFLCPYCGCEKPNHKDDCQIERVLKWAPKTKN